MKTTVRYILTDEPPRHSASPQRRDEVADLKAQCRTLGETLLEEQRMRYEVEREDAVALADMKAQRDALADVLLKAWRDGVFVEADLDLANEAEAALRAAGRLS